MDAKWCGHYDIRTNPWRSSKPREKTTHLSTFPESLKISPACHLFCGNLNPLLPFQPSLRCFMFCPGGQRWIILVAPSSIMSFDLFNLTKLALGSSFLPAGCSFPRFPCFVMSRVKSTLRSVWSRYTRRCIHLAHIAPVVSFSFCALY